MIQLLSGDARDVLPTLAADSVQCVVTSPPYYALRSYLPDGHADKHREIGSEPTPDEYLATMVAVFREVRRVLRPDGTCWVNMGSSFVSKRIESDRHVVRRDLPDAFRSKIAQAMSAVWAGYESPEQAVQVLLRGDDSGARELRDASLQEVRDGFHGSQVPHRAGDGALLLDPLREVGQPNAQANNPDHAMCGMRQAGEADACGHAEEEDGDPLLLGGMLVSAQPEGTSLPVGRRTASEVEPGWPVMASRSDQTGPQSLPDMWGKQEAGGTSYSPVPQSPRGAVATIEWDNGLPDVPSRLGSQRDAMGGGADGTSQDTAELLARITFARAAIPRGFEQWCEPESVLKPKDDMAMPEMLAIALRDDGWFLRSRIIWHKPNPMPESVSDRPTNSHEHVFLLTKRSRYFYDADAVREPLLESTLERGYTAAYLDGKETGKSLAGRPGEVRGNATWRANPYVPSGRNLRNVWTIATAPYSDAHFATYPPELAERCIRAGTSERGACSQCGAPWQRITDTSYQKLTGSPRMDKLVTTTGWQPECKCGADVVPCRVLDPFAGAGTTLLVADRLQRDAIGIELNPDYTRMAMQRCQDDAPLFTSFPPASDDTYDSGMRDLFREAAD